METRRDVFHAIADPRRREIIDLIARKPMNVNSIADQFDVSRQAISMHVKVLTECGLIVINQNGRERVCEARLEKLKAAASWIDQYKQSWTEQFKSLERYLEKTKKRKR